MSTFTLRLPAVIVCGAALPAFAQSPTAAEPADLTEPSDSRSAANSIRFLVKVERPSGTVHCALYTSAFWLDEPARGVTAKIADDGRAECVFSNVQPGTYAISAFHDENGNGKLDTSSFGSPTEGTCTSRNARPKRGPSVFADARFEFSGEAIDLRATMIY